jgi:hypothetical protein
VAGLLTALNAPLRETDELREVCGIRLLTTADEVEVLANACREFFTGVFADEAADIVGFTLVEHGHNVHAEAASGEGDSNAVRVSHDLIGRKRRIRLDDSVAQPQHQ